MKKLIIGIITAFLVLTCIPARANPHADSSAITTIKVKTIEAERADILITRLNEINEMDKSNLDAPEKKELRKEVRTIKKDLNGMGDGIYISAGAIIIILILLIILL